MKKVIWIVLCFALIAAGIAGCTKAPAAETSAEAQTAETSAAVSTDSGDDQTAEKSLHVVYIPIQTGNPYFDPISQGLKDVVEAAGGVYETTAADVVDPTAQTPLIKAQIQKGVDVICISPTSVDALNDVCDEARAAGITVIMLNDDITGNESHRDACVVGTDYEQVGYRSIEVFNEIMGGEGDFVVISATTDSPFQNMQIGIYNEMLATSEYSGLNLLEVVYGNDEPEKSLTEAQAAIQKYENLKGLLCPTTVAYIAACQAVENAGMAGEIIVYGTAFPNQCREFLKSGVSQGAILWDTYRMGAVAGELCKAVVFDGFVIEEGATFTAGDYGEVAIGANNSIYGGPPLELYVDNVDDHNF